MPQKRIKYILMLAQTSYNLRNNCNFIPRFIKSVYHGSDIISYLRPKIWKLLPDNIKDSENIVTFKAKIKFRKPESCPCWLSKVYTGQKMKFSSKDFFSKCDQIRRKLQIWSNLLKKSLMENFIFYAVKTTKFELIVLLEIASCWSEIWTRLATYFLHLLKFKIFRE